MPTQYIEIVPELARTFVKLKQPRCPNDLVLLNNSCIYVAIRRKGCDEVLMCYDAWEIDVDGAVSFYWDQLLFCVDYGYYEGDVYVDCHKLTTISFVKRRPRALIDELRDVMASTCCPSLCPPTVCADGAIPQNINVT